MGAAAAVGVAVAAEVGIDAATMAAVAGEIGLSADALASTIGASVLGMGTGAISSAAQGGNIGQIFEGAGIGGLTGGVAGGVGGEVAGLLGDGALAGGAAGAIGGGTAGALGSAITGGNIAQGAEMGGITGGAMGAAGGLFGGSGDSTAASANGGVSAPSGTPSAMGLNSTAPLSNVASPVGGSGAGAGASLPGADVSLPSAMNLQDTGIPALQPMTPIDQVAPPSSPSLSASAQPGASTGGAPASPSSEWGEASGTTNSVMAPAGPVTGAAPTQTSVGNPMGDVSAAPVSAGTQALVDSIAFPSGAGANSLDPTGLLVSSGTPLFNANNLTVNPGAAPTAPAQTSISQDIFNGANSLFGGTDPNAATDSTWGKVGSAAIGAIPSLGIAGASALMGQQPVKGMNGVSSQAATLASQGQTLINYYNTGTLPPGMQSALQSATASAKAAIQSKYASMGMSGSSAEAQDLANVDIQSAGQAANILMTLYNQGASQEQAANGLYTELLHANMNQDSALTQSLGSFASGLAGGGTTLKLSAGQ